MDTTTTQPATQPLSPIAPHTGSTPGRAVAVAFLRIGGLVLVLALLAAGAASVVAGFFHQERNSTSTITAPVHRVVTQTDTGRIVVRLGATGRPVTITRHEAWSFHAPKTSSGVTDGVLKLVGDCSDRSFFAGHCSVDYDVTIPPGTALDLVSGTGTIRVTGADADLRVRTATGDIRLRAVTAPTVNAVVATGDVSLSFAKAPLSVNAQTDTGDVAIHVPADGTTYRVTSQTDVGESAITVPTDPAGQRTIDVKTATGDILVSTTP